MNRYIEEWRRQHQGWYICGAHGNFAIKSCGNNRIIVRNLKTIQESRDWLTNYRPGVKLYEYYERTND